MCIDSTGCKKTLHRRPKTGQEKHMPTGMRIDSKKDSFMLPLKNTSDSDIVRLATTPYRSPANEKILLGQVEFPKTEANKTPSETDEAHIKNPEEHEEIAIDYIKYIEDLIEQNFKQVIITLAPFFGGYLDMFVTPEKLVKFMNTWKEWRVRPSDEILKAFHAISPAPTDEFRWPILYLSNQCFSVSVKAQCCFPKATGVKAGFDDTKFWDVIQRWYHGHEVHPLGEVIKYSHGHKRLSECLALLKMAQAAYHRAYLQKTGRILRECHESMVRSALNQDSRQRHLPLPPARP
jgi:hypothetical protein